MRKLIIAGAAMLAAAPALAQPPVHEDDWGERAPLDARQIVQMAGAMERMVGAIMALPVGGIAAAVDPLGRGGIHPGDTLRDLAERDDPYAEARIRAGIRGTARGVAAMSGAVARIMPVLQQSIDEMSRSVAAAIDEVDDGEDY